jgi:hypothetical protein
LICERPLDSLDLEALSSGEKALVAEDSEARAHAAACPECGRRLALFREMEAWISDLPAVEVGPELASRVERLRGFSGPEKRSIAVWWPPVGLFLGFLAGSAALLSVPILTGSEQAGVLSAVLAVLGAEARTLIRLPGSLWAGLPGSVSAISDLLATERRFAALSILLLLPAGFSVTRLWLRRAASR